MSREAIMTALMSQLTGAVASTFTGTTVANNPAITGIGSTAKMFVGLTVVGGSIPAGAFIQSIDSLTQITLTAAPTKNGTAVNLITGFQTTGRRVKMWSQVTAQPALFLRNLEDEIAVREGQPNRRTMNVEAWIYSNAGRDPDIAPGTPLNYLIDAIESVIKPDNVLVNRNTLGGLVWDCKVDGKITYDPGDLDAQAKAIIPIRILIP